MPVMKQLRIGSVNYDTVGEASVTQVLASGTKIATVTIDGTATDLYAPEGGSSVDPASAAPLMDGTAAAGTSTKYAREDHVHPTDTSRAAASHTHAIADVTGLQTALDGKAASNHTHTPASIGAAASSHDHAIADVTNLQSALDGKQDTLVSGTSIKTVNGTSLLGSGDITTPTYTLPAATTDTLGGVKVDGTTITATDGVISAVGGGGGGGGSTLTLYADDNCWNLYVDSALATSLLESVDYDYDAAMSMLKNAGKVIVEWTDTIASAARYAVVCGAFYDTIDETFNVALIKVTSAATLTSIGLT